MTDRVSIWQAIPWVVLGWILCEIAHLVIR